MRTLALAIVIAATFASSGTAQTSIAIITGSTSGVSYPLGNAISAQGRAPKRIERLASDAAEAHRPKDARAG